MNFPLLASLSLSKDLIESKTQDVEREREIISFASLLNLSLHRRFFFFFFFSVPHRFAIRFRIKRTFPYVLSLSVRFDLIRSMCLRDSRDELVLITIRVEAIDLLKICGSWLHFECQSSRIDRFWFDYNVFLMVESEGRSSQSCTRHFSWLICVSHSLLNYMILMHVARLRLVFCWRTIHFDIHLLFVVIYVCLKQLAAKGDHISFATDFLKGV